MANEKQGGKSNINYILYIIAALVTKTNIQIHPFLIHLTVQQPLVCTRSTISFFFLPLHRLRGLSIYDVEIIFTTCTHFVNNILIFNLIQFSTLDRIHAWKHHRYVTAMLERNVFYTSVLFVLSIFYCTKIIRSIVCFYPDRTINILASN